MAPCSFACCGGCCSIFSVAGAIFCILFGILFDKEPHIVASNLNTSDAKDSAASLYGAAGIYVVTFALSIGCLFYDRRIQSRLARAGAFRTDNLSYSMTHQSTGYYEMEGRTGSAGASSLGDTHETRALTKARPGPGNSAEL